MAKSSLFLEHYLLHPQYLQTHEVVGNCYFSNTFFLDIVKAHFVKITFSALSAFFISYSINISTSFKKPNNINPVLKKSVLSVFLNSLPKDHYAQRTGQNFQERGINFFPHEVTKRKCNDYY